MMIVFSNIIESMQQILRIHVLWFPCNCQVFGRTVICRDLEVATKVAQSAEVDCITLEGRHLLTCIQGCLCIAVYLLLGIPFFLDLLLTLLWSF